MQLNELVEIVVGPSGFTSRIYSRSIAVDGPCRGTRGLAEASHSVTVRVACLMRR